MTTLAGKLEEHLRISSISYYYMTTQQWDTHAKELVQAANPTVFFRRHVV